MSRELPPLSLYVHIPWCVKKCPYCDFNSHQVTPDEARYFNALCTELHNQRIDTSKRPIVSVYFGGGTPNMFSADFYASFLASVREQFQLHDQCEITLEANPGDKRHHDYTAYHQAGINRLSIGVQSFHDACLQSLGRDYNSKQLLHTVQSACESDFDNINFDLIYALPNQSDDRVVQDIALAASFQPQHISAYELTIEPNTLFYVKRPSNLPNAKKKEHVYHLVTDTLNTAGYAQYEISAYCHPGSESVHNLNYWMYGDYLGLGAGAHSKITTVRAVYRYANIRLPERYIATAGSQHAVQSLTENDVFIEWCMNAFRLKNGVSMRCIEQNTLLSKAFIDKKLRPFADCFSDIGATVRLASHAYLRHNALLQQLL